MNVLKAELSSIAQGRPTQDERPVAALFAPQFDELQKGILEIAKKQDQGENNFAGIANTLRDTVQEVANMQREGQSRHHQVMQFAEKNHDKILESNRASMEEAKATFREEMQALWKDTTNSQASTSAAIDRLTSQAADAAAAQASFVREAEAARAGQTSALDAIAARVAESQKSIDLTATQVQSLHVRADEHGEALDEYRARGHKKLRGAANSSLAIACVDTPLHGAGAYRADNVSATESGHSNGEDALPHDSEMAPGHV